VELGGEDGEENENGHEHASEHGLGLEYEDGSGSEHQSGKL
jgi:hypothetical protein